jgi:hypothetical protein
MINEVVAGYILAASTRSSPEHLPVTGTSAHADIHLEGCHALSVGFPGREKSIITLFS